MKPKTPLARNTLLKTLAAQLVLFLLLALPAAVQAQDYRYTTDNGQITITRYNGPGGAVAIPKTIDGLPVTSIGTRAFQGGSLTSVTIPDSVTSLGRQALFRCTSLSTISVEALNSSFSSVDGVLFNQSKTTLIQYPPAKTGSTYAIPDSVTSLGDSAFYGYTGLTSITIPGRVTNIGDLAFYRCPNLTGITVEAINSAYSSVDGVLFNQSKTALLRYPPAKAGSAYTIPGGVTSIGLTAFDGCASLTSVTIPDSVTSVASQAFGGCAGLKNVVIPNSVTSLGSIAFVNCTGLTSVVVGNGVTGIGDSAFDTCTSLTNVTIGSGVTSFGSYAFADCARLTSVTIPNGVTSIGVGAFAGCPSLTSVAIPNSVTTVGGAAFASCVGLTNVTIGDGVTGIGGETFESCSGLISVTIGNSVTSIGQTAFAGCFNLTSVVIPNSVITIGRNAFAGCASLTSLAIPNSVTSLADYAFSGCTGLTNITIGSSVTSLGDYTFGGCTSLSAITVNIFNPAYGSVDGVLFDKSQTTLLQCPQGKAGAYKIPDNVTIVARVAFESCARLTGVTIGNSVTSIGDFAFSECANLTDLTIPESVMRIGDYAFNGCASLTSITIPDNVTDMGPGVFGGCTSLTGVYFHGNLPNVSDFVFNAGFGGADKATAYYLPGTTGWGQTLGGRPTAHWSLPNPLILGNGSTGVQDNRFGFTISWATSQPVVVEASTTLTNPAWAPVSTNALPGGSAYFSDLQWVDHPTRLYRVRSQ